MIKIEGPGSHLKIPESRLAALVDRVRASGPGGLSVRVKVGVDGAAAAGNAPAMLKPALKPGMFL